MIQCWDVELAGSERSSWMGVAWSEGGVKVVVVVSGGGGERGGSVAVS